MKKTLAILGVIAIIAVGYIWSTYNKLIVANEGIDKQWAQVESQYQRRFDLIPNLVESVKGIMGQEEKVFGDIAEARTNYAGAGSSNEKAEAASQIEGALSRLLVIMENYPELKSAETVQTLMAQLEGTENRVSVERKRYNDEVNIFNVLIKRFPANIIANQLGFEARIYFEAEEGSETAPKVDFSG